MNVFFSQLPKQPVFLGHGDSGRNSPNYGNAGRNSPDSIGGLIPLTDGTVQCHECGKTLSTMGTGKRHYRLVHANDKSIRVPCPVCQRTFAAQSYVTDHLRKVHGSTQHRMLKSSFESDELE